MTITASGFVSSRLFPSSRMAAISASSCAGSSLGGLVNNCGACTVAIAATIFPILITFLLDTDSTPSRSIDELDAKLYQLRPQSVHVQAKVARLQPDAILFFFDPALIAEFRH